MPTTVVRLRSQPLNEASACRPNAPSTSEARATNGDGARRRARRRRRPVGRSSAKAPRVGFTRPGSASSRHRRQGWIAATGLARWRRPAGYTLCTSHSLSIRQSKRLLTPCPCGAARVGLARRGDRAAPHSATTEKSPQITESIESKRFPHPLCRAYGFGEENLRRALISNSQAAPNLQGVTDEVDEAIYWLPPQQITEHLYSDHAGV
jgi:hypothetical protein